MTEGTNRDGASKAFLEGGYKVKIYLQSGVA